ncbi:Primosomal protein N' [Candidatus Erwinia haradaeae]|uniref:Replication restart protein PriA n=1 Tax=Candidatus Erwinia haradaeae TaxID=1922217 RepID=A0A451D3V6_9GAMM|nr:Primosomal protein N' [Candidatus Erwinia haradaeae]
MYIVQVALPVFQNHYFDYILPKNIKNIVIGGRVRVPFNNKKIIGIVINISKTYHYSLNYFPTIYEVLDSSSLYHPVLWYTLKIIADYYHFSLGQILFHSIPPLLRQGYLLDKSLYNKMINNKFIEIENILYNSAYYTKTKNLITSSTDELNFKNNFNKFYPKKYSVQICHSKHTYTSKKYKKIGKNLYFNYIKNNIFFTLNQEQNDAVKTIEATYNKFCVWLLNDINIQNQTKIYLKILETILIQKKQVLVLLPTINLIFYLLPLLFERFSVKIDILHSKLTPLERLNVWRRAREGKTYIVIGTRSVLFTPFTTLGMIIMYEEHEQSYIHNESCQYHARDLAILRAKQENVPIIMGSITPTLETLYNVQLGKYKKITFKEDLKSLEIKRILVDLKNTIMQNGLSLILIQKITQHLQKNNQVFLFLSHYNFSPVLLCQECKWIPKCTRCNYNYIVCKKKKQLYCRYCNKRCPIPFQCLRCDSTYLLQIGLGIEQIKNTLNTLFPDIPLIHINHNKTCYKNSLNIKCLENSCSGAHILLCTKMTSQIHYFSKITLIAFINIDSILFSANFRTIEHFTQLYYCILKLIENTQQKVDIILQTYYPNHSLLQTLLYKKYDVFATQELFTRKCMLLPPYIHQVFFCAEGYNNQKVYQFLKKIIIFLQSDSSYNSLFRMIGPHPSLKSKIKGRYRWTIIIQHPSRLILYRLIKNTRQFICTSSNEHNIKWNFFLYSENN